MGQGAVALRLPDVAPRPISSNCGLVVVGYQLEKKTPFGSWEKVTDAPILGESATVPDLVEGEEYEYRVAAVTDAGVGEYSNATPPVKAERKKRKTTHKVTESVSE